MIKWLPRLLVALGVFFLLWIDRSFNPDGNSLFPGCMWRSLTGLECAGCGVQRALHAVLNGHFKTAFFLNSYMFVLGPVWIVWYFTPRLRRINSLFYLLAASIPLYIVLRNIASYCFEVHF